MHFASHIILAGTPATPRRHALQLPLHHLHKLLAFIARQKSGSMTLRQAAHVLRMRQADARVVVGDLTRQHFLVQRIEQTGDGVHFRYARGANTPPAHRLPDVLPHTGDEARKTLSKYGDLVHDLMSRLSRESPTPRRQLVARLGRSAPTARKILDAMVEAGYVTRFPLGLRSHEYALAAAAAVTSS